MHLAIFRNQYYYIWVPGIGIHISTFGKIPLSLYSSQVTASGKKYQNINYYTKPMSLHYWQQFKIEQNSFNTDVTFVLL